MRKTKMTNMKLKETTQFLCSSVVKVLKDKDKYKYRRLDLDLINISFIHAIQTKLKTSLS